jgi:hypothetical protein
VGDVKNFDPVGGDSIEKLVGIRCEKRYANTRTLLDFRCGS